MPLLWLPEATRDTDPRIDALSFTETTDPKGVLHTTETTGWPSYAGWSVPPHVTVRVNPSRDGVLVRQHIPFSRAAFALKNLPGGVETNRDYAFQVELVGTCEKGGDAFRAGAFFWPAAPDAVLLDLFDKVVEPMSTGLGIPLRAPDFQTYPESYGPRSGTNDVRLSGPAWDNGSGWFGHQHVPENVHGDPGAFPWSRMVAAVERRRAEREDPFAMPLTPADAKLIGDAVAAALVEKLPRAIVSDLLAWDTIPDYRARAAGADPASPEANVSTRTVLGHVFESARPPAEGTPESTRR